MNGVFQQIIGGVVLIIVFLLMYAFVYYDSKDIKGNNNVNS